MSEEAKSQLGQAASYFNALGADYVFLMPTKTGLRKSILDATLPIRRFLERNYIHNYSAQARGQSNKNTVPVEFWGEKGAVRLQVSLVSRQPRWYQMT
jgi:hypothetical protein